MQSHRAFGLSLKCFYLNVGCSFSTKWSISRRYLWSWKPPSGLAKVEKLSLSYYSYNPKHITIDGRSPIIAMHGLFVSKEYFYGLTAMLANKLRRPIYVLDMRNHGESPHCNYDGKATLMVLAQDVVNFMDEFNIGKALLIGQGLGARAMIQLAQLNQPRVEKVVSIDVSQDGPYLYSHNFPKYINYLGQIDLNGSNSSLSYSRLVMKEILRGQVKNGIMLKFVLDNMRLNSESGKYCWRFNTQVLEQILRHWSTVKQINYGNQSDSQLLNIVSRNNYITSEDYLDLKKAFKSCQVAHISSRQPVASKPYLVNAIEKFAHS